jgi:hypothetical protein
MEWCKEEEEKEEERCLVFINSKQKKRTRKNETIKRRNCFIFFNINFSAKKLS